MRVFDEGIKVWLDEALAAGLSPIELEATEFDAMGRLGWRKVSLPKARFPRLARDIDTLDFSGWPIYANASLPEQVAYEICDALAAREAEIPWERETGGTALHMGRESDSTPMDVPHQSTARTMLARWCPLKYHFNWAAQACRRL